MPTTYREGKMKGFDTAVGNVGNILLQKMLMEQEQKKKVQQAIQQSILDAALKDQRLRPGADLSGLDTSQGMQGMLGQIPQMFERAPAEQTTSETTTPQSFSDMMTARGILARTPEEWAEEGMATPGKRKMGTGFLWSGFGPKSQREYELTPDAFAAQEEAKSVLGGPKITTRKTYKGGAIDTTGQIRQFDSIEEAEAAGLEPGTIVYIQGRKAIIE